MQFHQAWEKHRFSSRCLPSLHLSGYALAGTTTNTSLLWLLHCINYSRLHATVLPRCALLLLFVTFFLLLLLALLWDLIGLHSALCTLQSALCTLQSALHVVLTPHLQVLAEVGSLVGFLPCCVPPCANHVRGNPPRFWQKQGILQTLRLCYVILYLT